jgi:DNA-binding beta-propeller fold protein YncE
MKPRLLFMCIAITALFTGALIVYAQAPQYHLITEVKIGGGNGWDYLTVDPDGRRLYVAHGTSVNVIDIDKNTVVGEITDTPGVHGFIAVPSLGKGFTSNGRENKASVVDLKTLKTLSKVDTGINPDALLFEPKKQEVYTFNGGSKDATVFSAATGMVVATIPLGGKPETGVADPSAGRVYVNNEDTAEVKVIDVNTHMVVATWPLAPGTAPTGMAFDAKDHLLIVGCSNSMMILMDSTNGKIVANIPAGAGIDAAAFDPGTGMAYVSAGAGSNVTIAKADGGKWSAVQTVQTARNARTMALDPKTHNIYLAALDYQPAQPGAPAPAPGARGRGAPAVPDSFKVMVFGTGPAK